MAERKNHHFVPQFYFRRFSEDGRSICLLRRSSGQTVGQASIKAQASKNKFYRSDEIEKALGFVEGHASEALRRLDAATNPVELDEDTVGMILVWLALQSARTATARLVSENFNNRLTQLYAEMEAANRTDIDDVEKDRLIAEARGLKGDPVEMQLAEMRTASQSAHYLGDLARILLVNKTNRPFIFSDAPVVLYNAYLRAIKVRGVLGYTTPGLMVFMPLSPKTTLALLDAEVYRTKRAQGNRVFVRELKDVMALNALQMHSASECVYFHDAKYGSYVQALWNAERKALAAHAGKVVEAPGKSAETGEDIGDIMHSFRPQLPYRFDLSFLDYDAYALGDHRNLRREAWSHDHSMD